MTFHIYFFARDVQSARAKLHEAHAPSAVKALIEVALAGISRPRVTTAPSAPSAPAAAWLSQDAKKVKGFAAAPASPRAPGLCGVKVEATGHIDDNGQLSFIQAFKVEPLFD